MASLLRQSLLNCQNGVSCCPYYSGSGGGGGGGGGDSLESNQADADSLFSSFLRRRSFENTADKPLVITDIEEEKRLVFIGVMTAQKYLDTRAKSVYETWGRRFFLFATLNLKFIKIQSVFGKQKFK